MAFFSFTRQRRRRRVIFAALLSAAIACGFLGVSSTQLRAQADSYGGDLVLLKDAAHVQMNGNQPAYDETGLPIGLDSTADAPLAISRSATGFCTESTSSIAAMALLTASRLLISFLRASPIRSHGFATATWSTLTVSSQPITCGCARATASARTTGLRDLKMCLSPASAQIPRCLSPSPTATDSGMQKAIPLVWPPTQPFTSLDE